MSYRFDSKNHIHQLEIDGEWKPLIGTSSVGSVIAKPLTWWASGKALESFGWLNPKYATPEQRFASAEKVLNDLQMKASTPEDERAEVEEYIKKLDTAYRAHDTFKNQSATAGTDLHAEIEKYVKVCIDDYAGASQASGGNLLRIADSPVRIFAEWATQNVKRFLASEIHCYSKELWVGGISDIVAEMNDGLIAIIDIKSSKEAYASQFWQVAGYDILLSENGGFTADGEKVFELPGKVGVHVIFPFGMDKPTAQSVYDVESNREAFRHEVALYRLLNLNKDEKC